MKKLNEIKEKLQNEFSLAFIYNNKDGYIDCYYNNEQRKNMYHLRYGTDEYDTMSENAVFTFPFIDGKSLSEIYADVEIQPC